MLNATKAFGADGGRWDGRARATAAMKDPFRRTLEVGPLKEIPTNILINFSHHGTTLLFNSFFHVIFPCHFLTLLFVSPPLSLCSRPVVSFSYPLPT